MFHNKWYFLKEIGRERLDSRAGSGKVTVRKITVCRTWLVKSGSVWHVPRSCHIIVTCSWWEFNHTLNLKFSSFLFSTSPVLFILLGDHVVVISTVHQCESVMLLFSCSVMSNSLWLHGLRHVPHSLSFTNSWSLLKFLSIESVMLSNHLTLCCPLLFLSVFPSIRVFCDELALHIWCPKYWSFTISPSNEYSG